MLPSEAFDPNFQGQNLDTTYFDTQDLEQRKNRALHSRYITLRLRCYQGRRAESYAFSAKTEQEKFRAPLTPSQVHSLLAPGAAIAGILADILPPHLNAGLLEISHDEPLLASALVCCLPYAVEDDVDRYTPKNLAVLGLQTGIQAFGNIIQRRFYCQSFGLVGQPEISIRGVQGTMTEADHLCRVDPELYSCCAFELDKLHGRLLEDMDFRTRIPQL
jgi:hypothetical protein